jgi:hypothetical protein
MHLSGHLNKPMPDKRRLKSIAQKEKDPTVVAQQAT